MSAGRDATPAGSPSRLPLGSEAESAIGPQGAASQRAPHRNRLPLHRRVAGTAGRTADHGFASRRSSLVPSAGPLQSPKCCCYSALEGLEEPC